MTHYFHYVALFILGIFLFMMWYFPRQSVAEKVRCTLQARTVSQADPAASCSHNTSTSSQSADACIQQRRLENRYPRHYPMLPLAAACRQGTAGERDSNRRGLPVPLSTFRNRNISVTNCLSVRASHSCLLFARSFVHFCPIGRYVQYAT